MKVKILYEGDCGVFESPTKRLLCILCNKRLTTGSFELNPMTEAVFLGNETIMALIHAENSIHQISATRYRCPNTVFNDALILIHDGPSRVGAEAQTAKDVQC